MPSSKGTLSENQIWDVVNYLKRGLAQAKPGGDPEHRTREAHGH